MIEARFDDLVAGAERAFRLVEPVGVIEARRSGEVAGAIEAEVADLTQGLGETAVELRVWKKSAESRLGPSRTSR